MLMASIVIIMILFSERELARAGEIYQRTLELVEAKVVHVHHLLTTWRHLYSLGTTCFNQSITVTCHSSIQSESD